MPFRSIYLPETGEHFRVRVPPEAISDWLRDREQLRLQGQVDRPPDLDTGPIRSWFPHPGEENHPHFQDQALFVAEEVAENEKRGITSSFPVLIGVWGVGDRLLKYIVTGESDGGFNLKCKIDNQSTGTCEIREMRLPPDMPGEMVADEINQQLQIFDLLATSLGAPTPELTTWEHFDQQDAEFQLAIDEVGAEFGPIPQGFSGARPKLHLLARDAQTVPVPDHPVDTKADRMVQ